MAKAHSFFLQVGLHNYRSLFIYYECRHKDDPLRGQMSRALSRVCSHQEIRRGGILPRVWNRRSVQMTRWWRVRYTIAYNGSSPLSEHANGDPQRIIRKSRRSSFRVCCAASPMWCWYICRPSKGRFFLFYHPASDHSPIAQLCPFNSVQKVKNASKTRNLPGKILQCTGGWAIIFQ